MNVKTSKLNNGVTVVTHKMVNLESATIGIFIKAGTRNEQENQHGLAHFLEHMAFKGTTHRSARQIAEEIENVGGDINAMTSVETTSYYIRILHDNVHLAIDILHDILENSVFEKKEIEREKHVVLQEIGANEDSPCDIIYDFFQQAAFQNQAIGKSILGTPETISSFTSQDLRKYLNEHYHGSNIVFAAAGGGIDHDEILNMVQKRFTGFVNTKPKEPVKANYTGGEIIRPRELMETQILIGFEGKAYHVRDFYTSQMLASILGGGMSSRLFQQIRENLGLCYSIHSFHWGFSDTGIFGIHAATSKDNIAQLIPVVLHELRKICDKITEEEVSRSRAQVRANLLMSQESSIAKSEQIGRQTLLYGRTIENKELMDRINAITPERISDLAGRIFIGSQATLAAVGSVHKLMNVESIMKFLR